MRRILTLVFLFSLVVYLAPYKSAFQEEPESDLDVRISLENEQVFIEEEFEVEIILENTSEEEQELNFNTGQRFDIIVLGSKEDVLYRWSQDKMFTQALGTVVLAPEEEKVYDAKIVLPTDIATGDYQMKGLITASEQIFSQAKTITVKE